MENKILLIVPPTRTYTQRLPLGLMEISSYIESKGYVNNIIEFKGISAERAFTKTIEQIRIRKPSYVGISCLVSETEAVKKLCEKIRELDEDTKIIVGGPHPSINPNHFLELNIDFDYIVKGEGEITFYELIECLEKNGKISSVAGLVYKKSGKLHFNKPRPLIQNLDDLPFPAYDQVDMDYYCRPNVWALRPIYISSFNMFTSRGCPYSCNFCVAHTIFGRKVRFHSPEKVVEHIEFIISRYKVDAIYFGDESFTVSKERVYRMFNLLRNKGIKILFGCQTRVNLLDEKLLRFMKKNGCMQVDFGIESGSDKMLKVMNKGTSVEMIKKVGRICNKINLRHLANMLINLPGEELSDISRSLKLARDMKYNIVLWNVYTPFPGVCFGSKLDLADLEIILEYPSRKTIDLLENKYKFGNYKKSIQDVLDYVYSNTFHPKNIRFAFSLHYFVSFYRTISYIFDIRYVAALLKSKRKMDYIVNIVTQKTHI